MDARKQDGDNLINLNLIRSRSRDLVRNNPVAKGVIDTVVSGTIGSGMRMISAVDGAALGLSSEEAYKFDQHIENEFILWAENYNCDIERTLDFYGLQKLFLTQALEGGDVFAILTARNNKTPYEFALNIIEAEQCATPMKLIFSPYCKGGVKKDKYGAPVSYFFINDSSDKNLPFLLKESYETLFLRNNMTEIPAFHSEGFRQVLHYMDKTRPGQSRGVPLLAPVMEQLKQIERYAESELMAAVISGMFTVFVHDVDNQSMNRGSSFGRVMPGEKRSEDDLVLGPGTIVQMNGDKRIETVNPARPNAQFAPFYEAIIKQIAVGLNIPFEIIMKHFTASYSASQGAILEAWRFFRDRREYFIRYFCRPVYERFFREAVLKGRINAPGFDDPIKRRAYLSSEWIGPARGMIDERKEVEAAAKRIALGISTRKIEAIRLMGQDWNKILPEIIREQEIIKANGLDISSETKGARKDDDNEE